MRARFIGNPASNGEGPESISVFGVEFVKGEWAEVSDGVAARLSTNNHFETRTAALKPVEAFDHDGDGKAGGGVAAKPRKAKR